MNKIYGYAEGKGLKIAIIASRFNEPIVRNLLEGAVEGLKDNGVSEENIDVVFVPGAFEIPLMVRKLCRKNLEQTVFNGFITLGCVIKGDTAHFEYVCKAAADGVNRLNMDYEIPIAFGVLTCYDAKQAFERSELPPNAENNKGYESALSLLETISVLNKV